MIMIRRRNYPRVCLQTLVRALDLGICDEENYRISSGSGVEPLLPLLRDSYDVEIEPGQDDVVIFSVTICIDQVAY